MDEEDLIASRKQASNDHFGMQDCLSCTLSLDHLFRALKDHCVNLATELRQLGMYREANLFYDVEQDYAEIESELNMTLEELRAEQLFKREQAAIKSSLN